MAGVDSIAAQGEPQLTGHVTVSPGSGITLAQVGQDIEISLTTPETPPVAGYLAWYDAADPDAILAYAGDPDGTWHWLDKSGNNYHAGQGVEASRPIFGTRTINGLNVLDFSGVNQYFDTVVDASDRTQTTFIVGMVDALTTFQTIRATVNSAAGNDWRIDQTSGVLTTLSENTAGIGTSTGAVVAATPFIAVQRLSATDLVNYVNGVEDTDVNATTFTAGRVMRIGARGDLSEDFNGVIGEIIVYSTTLSNGDTASVIAYLEAKWGL